MDTGLRLSKLPFIDCSQAIEILQNIKKNVAFIDVRNRKTYVQQFAFGSVHCSLDRLKFIITDLVPDQETSLIIIGATLSTIPKIISILNKKKFGNYYFIKNNYKAWAKAKLPMWAGEFTLSKAFGEWVEKTGSIRNIYPKELYQLHQKKPDTFLQIDARPKQEYEKFTLPFSKQCSGGELPAYLESNYTDKDIIIHCAGRTRSIVAYQTLLDFNVKNKKFVLNGGTQNWVLNGLERAYKYKSDLAQNKINLIQDMKLAKKIITKFKLPHIKQLSSIVGVHAFSIKSEIIQNKPMKLWKNVNATTLIQNTDKFIASTSTKIYIYSEIPSSAVFAVLWLRRMGYQAIWHIDRPHKKLKKSFCKKEFIDQTYFFSKRHLGKKSDAKKYLNWEHSLIPTLQKWGCRSPWISMKNKNTQEIINPVHKVYQSIKL
ncbi:MAG: rhodanese-like domain-containing protein [Bacteroidetes bacterium]|nr:rhodanese-like domain-containing protein [Bacteroidota bacterium]